LSVVLFLSVFLIAACGLIHELIAGTLASYPLGKSFVAIELTVGLEIPLLMRILEGRFQLAPKLGLGRKATLRAARFAVLALAAFVLLSPGAVVSAEEPDALTVARKCDAALKGKTERGAASMTVRTPEWQRTLEITFWYDYPEKTFIRITAPAKNAGTGTLRLRTNMWTYLPSVERVIKVPPSLMLQSWMGSDFTNDDLVKESSLPTDYTHRIEAETSEDGDLCYRLIATPKANAPVVWEKLVLLVRKVDFLPRREEFYDDQGVLQKTLYLDNIRRTGSRDYPMRWRMVSHNKPGHETTLTFSALRRNS
jgi:outer membrane lipoprotein-sorting protein